MLKGMVVVGVKEKRGSVDDDQGPIITDWTDDDGDVNMSTLVDRNVPVVKRLDTSKVGGTTDHVLQPGMSASDPVHKGYSQFKMPNMSTQPGSCPVTFADMLKDKTPKKVVRISEMRNNNCVAGANVTIPLEVVDEVSSRFANTLYGYFIGKRLAFPIVENYVRNTWAKFGLQRVMLNNSFFMFQFATKEGMERVLEEGPWLIRLVPIF